MPAAQRYSMLAEALCTGLCVQRGLCVVAARTMTDLVRLLVGANASRGTSRYVLASGAVAVAAILASAAGASATLCWNVAWTAAAVSAITGVLLGRAWARGANRRRWTLWSAAAGCWLIGQLAWDLFAVVGLPASPNVADIGYWGFAVLVIVSMLRVPGRSRSLARSHGRGNAAADCGGHGPDIRGAMARRGAFVAAAARTRVGAGLPRRVRVRRDPDAAGDCRGLSEPQPVDGVAAGARRDHRSSVGVHPLERAAAATELCDWWIGARSAVGARAARDRSGRRARCAPARAGDRGGGTQPTRRRATGLDVRRADRRAGSRVALSARRPVPESRLSWGCCCAESR